MEKEEDIDWSKLTKGQKKAMKAKLKKQAEEQAAKVNKDCILYLQPEWSVRDKVVPLIVDFVMANPQWKVSLQTHKYLNIP